MITNECTICFEELTSLNSVKLEGCDHLFCRECIIKWDENKSNCPMCRRIRNYHFQISLKRKNYILELNYDHLIIYKTKKKRNFFFKKKKSLQKVEKKLNDSTHLNNIYLKKKVIKKEIYNIISFDSVKRLCLSDNKVIKIYNKSNLSFNFCTYYNTEFVIGKLKLYMERYHNNKISHNNYEQLPEDYYNYLYDNIYDNLF